MESWEGAIEYVRKYAGDKELKWIPLYRDGTLTTSLDSLRYENDALTRIPSSYANAIRCTFKSPEVIDLHTYDETQQKRMRKTMGQRYPELFVGIKKATTAMDAWIQLRNANDASVTSDFYQVVFDAAHGYSGSVLLKILQYCQFVRTGIDPRTTRASRSPNTPRLLQDGCVMSMSDKAPDERLSSDDETDNETENEPNKKSATQPPQPTEESPEESPEESNATTSLVLVQEAPTEEIVDISEQESSTNGTASATHEVEGVSFDRYRFVPTTSRFFQVAQQQQWYRPPSKPAQTCMRPIEPVKRHKSGEACALDVEHREVEASCSEPLAISKSKPHEAQDRRAPPPKYQQLLRTAGKCPSLIAYLKRKGKFEYMTKAHWDCIREWAETEEGMEWLRGAGLDPLSFHLHHVIAYARGGPYSVYNCVFAPGSANGWWGKEDSQHMRDYVGKDACELAEKHQMWIQEKLRTLQFSQKGFDKHLSNMGVS